MIPRSARDAFLEPGEVVLASVSNPVENPNSQGKIRPVVLIARRHSRWLVMGLTSKPTYADGTPRTPVPFPQAAGLHGPGYLWGHRPTAICVFEVRSHLGWVDPHLAAAIIEQAHLAPEEAAGLVRALATCDAA